MPLEWLCVCDAQADASGVRRCSSCEPMWTEPGQAPRAVERAIGAEPEGFDFRNRRLYDPDDAEDLAEGSPYIWDIPESE